MKVVGRVTRAGRTALLYLFSDSTGIDYCHVRTPWRNPLRRIRGTRWDSCLCRNRLVFHVEKRCGVNRKVDSERRESPDHQMKYTLTLGLRCTANVIGPICPLLEASPSPWHEGTSVVSRQLLICTGMSVPTNSAASNLQHLSDQLTWLPSTGR
jgi:hypothetical protein